MNMVGVLFRNFMERIALSLSLRVNLYPDSLRPPTGPRGRRATAEGRYARVIIRPETVAYHFRITSVREILADIIRIIQAAIIVRIETPFRDLLADFGGLELPVKMSGCRGIRCGPAHQ